MPRKLNFHYRCSECSKTYDVTPGLMICPDCSINQRTDEPLRGVLEVVCIGSLMSKFNVYDLLPVEKRHFPPMPVGETPLWSPDRLRKRLGFPRLFFKDDTCNPTGSLKDRASFLVAAFAKKYGIKDIAVASTGNAASSMAGIGAAAGLNITIFIPKTAPKAKMIQSLQYGARVVLVDGNYDKAFDLSLEYSKCTGALSRNTAYNPMTIEGKKTASLEIYRQLGHKIPDYLFVPVGDGVILAGIFKGFSDLLEMGLIEKMPVVYAVQAEGSNAISRAYTNGEYSPLPTSTIADSICVDIPRNGYNALKKMKEFGGSFVNVSDSAILNAQIEMSSSIGLFAEPAGATAYAGFLSTMGTLEKDSTVVILVTGNGLKDIDSATKGVNPPSKAISSIDEIV